jgi:hypothetical protein
MADCPIRVVAVIASAFVASACPAFPAAADPQTRAVVELFTSQGCSSCPTADRLLKDLSADPTVIALSLPIDYWDYLGWKDTLADARNTARQKGYSKARGDRTVYTPQLVINGVAQAPGSDKAAVETALARSHPDARVLSVPVELALTGETVTVTTPAAAGDAMTAEVWLCPLTRAVQVEIGRGENRGRTVTYTNVVRGWIKLGEWTGAAKTFELKRQDVKADGADAFAVLVQKGAIDMPGAVVGAAFAALP